MLLKHFALVSSLTILFNIIFTAASFALSFTREVPPEIQAQMIDDMHYVQQIEGSGATPLFQQIFGGPLDGSRLSEFFNSRITKVDLGDCGENSGALACTDSKFPKTMFLTSNFSNQQLPQIVRISILFHEARHTEKTNHGWEHVNCPVPFKDAHGKDVRTSSGQLLEGLRACDDTSFGSYGLQVELLKNLQYFCKNCSQKVMKDAKLYGDALLIRVSDPGAHEALEQDVREVR